jgi:hypothetical protein
VAIPRISPAAADRHEHRGQIARRLIHQLHRHGALSGDDQRIVERMHERRAALVGQLLAVALRLGVVIADQHDRRRPSPAPRPP